MRNLLAASVFTVFTAGFIVPSAAAHCCNASNAVVLINSNAVVAKAESGVSVYRPTAILNPERARVSARINAAQKAKQDAQKRQAKIAAAQVAKQEARLQAIENTQKTLLERSTPKKTKKRLVYYSNGASYARYVINRAINTPSRKKSRTAIRNTVTTQAPALKSAPLSH